MPALGDKDLSGSVAPAFSYIESGSYRRVGQNIDTVRRARRRLRPTFRRRRGGALRANNWRKRPAVAAVGALPVASRPLPHRGVVPHRRGPWIIDLVHGHLFEKDREALPQRMSRRARAG